MIVIRNVRLIDAVADTARAGVDVTIGGERIAAIEPSRPGRRVGRDVEVLDLDGVTVLPGLIDCHAHYTIDPYAVDGFEAFARDTTEAAVLRAAGMAGIALRAGVTTARSAGSPADLDIVLRDAIAAGHVAGPRLLAAGRALTITGGHGRLFGREVDGELEFVRAARATVRQGADVIKAVASEASMLTTPNAGVEEMTSGELEAVVREARRLGRRVMAHAQNSVSVVRSARAGVASVEHAWLADEAAIAVLAETGTPLVPTLVVTDVAHGLDGLTEAQRRRQDEIEPLHRRSTETAIRLGVRALAGTDTGERGVLPDMVAREVRLLQDHGARAIDAIRGATAWAAELLGLAGEIGTVEVGKVADLIVVHGDPLTDLRRLERPRVVLQRGRVVAAARDG